VVCDGIGDTPLHFFHGRHAGQWDGEFVGSRGAEMQVRIVEARHEELTVKMNGLGAFLAAAAIEQNMVEFSDAADFVIGDGHGFGPRLRWIIGVNAAVRVINRTERFLLGANFRMKYEHARNCGTQEKAGNGSQSI
jgi:hypothetical protein